MSAKKPNISQIDQYLKGKLDARAMHQLERQAQDDPFLMDALEGYDGAGTDQQANLADLKERLAKRVAPAKERSIIIWRVLPLAASVLVMLGVGYWLFKPKPVVPQYANVVTVDKKPETILVPSPTKKETIVKQGEAVADMAIAEPPTATTQPIAITPHANNETRLSEIKIAGAASPTYKADTVEYIANNYKVRPNAKVDEVLKKMEGMEVDPNGNVTFQGQPVTKAKLNGKDFTGGDITQATKNLPADIIDKIQIVDDYGDQAAKTGIKDGSPTKILNLTTDTNKQSLIANNRPAPVLREVTIANPAMVENKVVGRAAGIATPNPTNSRPVTGVILDANGVPIIGATVKVDGANNGVLTDIKGQFKIELPANKDLLAVNSIGYNPKQVKVGNQNDLKIAMNESSNSLNEVVVVGYGTKKQTACTENPEFKKEFFDNITTAEKYVSEQVAHAKHTVKEKAYKKALQFIAKHTKVPMGDDYANMAYFQADKKLWLNWYEANKCGNLK